jgi:sorbitol-specific phosphotransferase system component IIBC
VRIAETVKGTNGKERLTEGLVHLPFGEVVSSGPGRLIAAALACAIGVWVAKRRPPLAQVVWWAGVALSLRCVFECVMNPYYLMPGLAIVLVCAALVGSSRLLVAVIVGTAVSYLSYRHMGPWTYYIIVTGLLFVVLATAWPGGATSSSDVGNGETISGDDATLVERATTTSE